MFGSGQSVSSAEVVARRVANAPLFRPIHSPLAEPLERLSPSPDRQEMRRRRNARRVALALMAGSSVVTASVFYGAWILLHSVIAAAG